MLHQDSIKVFSPLRQSSPISISTVQQYQNNARKPPYSFQPTRSLQIKTRALLTRDH